MRTLKRISAVAEEILDLLLPILMVVIVGAAFFMLSIGVIVIWREFGR